MPLPQQDEFGVKWQSTKQNKTLRLNAASAAR